jgi:hypothetical protein
VKVSVVAKSAIQVRLVKLSVPVGVQLSEGPANAMICPTRLRPCVSHVRLGTLLPRIAKTAQSSVTATALSKVASAFATLAMVVTHALVVPQDSRAMAVLTATLATLMMTTQTAALSSARAMALLARVCALAAQGSRVPTAKTVLLDTLVPARVLVIVAHWATLAVIAPSPALIAGHWMPLARVHAGEASLASIARAVLEDILGPTVRYLAPVMEC